MNKELEFELNKILGYHKLPLTIFPSKILNFEFPKGLWAILNVANGFLTKDGNFRVFGTEFDNQIQNIANWNKSSWKKEYGKYLKNVLFIAEDIFGDQYGYRFGTKREFVKFFCEGGQIEILGGGINQFIELLLSPRGKGMLDLELISEARQIGLNPKPSEHFAFKIPLIVGGPKNISNLTVEKISLHLGLLAQISSKNRNFPNDKKIKGFR